MALPIAPIAGLALRYGAVALATYAVARAVQTGHRDQRGEDALDDVPEGLTYRNEPEQVNGTARIRRVFRFGANGPGLEIDAAGLGRIKFRKA